MPPKLPGNGNNIAKLTQKLDDHDIEQCKQFDRVEKRLDNIEKELGSKGAQMFKFWMPIVLSILILVGGWLYTFSRVESKVAELETGKIENRQNIQLLIKQSSDMATSMAIRDERYSAILEKLELIQRQLDRIQRNK